MCVVNDQERTQTAGHEGRQPAADLAQGGVRAREGVRRAAEIFGEDRVIAADRLDDAIEAAVTLADEAVVAGLPGSGGVLVTGSVITAGDARKLPGMVVDRRSHVPACQGTLTLPRLKPGDARFYDAANAAPPRRACPARSMFLAAL